MIYGAKGDAQLTSDAIKERRLLYTGNTYVMIEGNKTWSEGTFKLNLSKNPRIMEGKEIRGQNKGMEWQDIYVLADDVLIICSSHKPGPPTRFTTQDGSYLMIYKREKP